MSLIFLLQQLMVSLRFRHAFNVLEAGIEGYSGGD